VYTLLLILHLASAVALLALLVLALRNHTEPAAPWLAGVCAFMLLWVGAYVCELAAAQLADKLIWADLQFVAACALPVLWLVAVRLAMGQSRPPRWLLGVLSAVALALVVSIYINPGHLFRGQPSLDSSGPLTFVAADYGALYYYVGMPFACGLLAVALLTLVRVLVRGPRELRARSALLLAGTALPVVSGALFVFGLLPWPNFNPAMASVSVAAVAVACALLYGRLFSIAPMARGRVVEQLADGVIICDAHSRVNDCNPAARRLLPELRRAKGRLLTDCLAGRVELLRALDSARDYAAVATHASGDSETSLDLLEHGVGSVQIWAGDGAGPTQRHHLSVVTTPVYSRSGRRRGEAIVLRDVTSSVEVLQRLRRMATTDGLTGLLGRGHLLELGRREVDRAERQGGSLAVILLDIDGFKAINDTYGHLAGDELLRAVASVARSELRSFDLLGRYGGDEFAGVFPGLGPQEALALAERLRLAIAALAVWHGDACLRATVSIGVACGGDEAESLTDLIAAADGALYAAKTDGRDGVALAANAASRR
jgi:diguanylate cyclase (GGDEF)-like protein